MRFSRFYGRPLRRKVHQLGELSRASRERVMGAIRGVAHRERLLCPSPAKAIQRRIRCRLLAAYLRRFGPDEFYLAMNFVKEVHPSVPSFWLARGYAHWRERLLGKVPQRPFTQVVRVPQPSAASPIGRHGA